MNLRDHIAPEILPILDTAVAQGFSVFVLRPDKKMRRSPIGFAHVCLDLDGSFGTVSGTCNRFDVPTLGAPIRPDRRFGSSVLVDYDGTPEDAVRALREVCESPTIPVRFVGKPAPVEKNHGYKALASWPVGGAGRFVEFTADDAARSITSTPPTPDQEKELTHV